MREARDHYQRSRAAYERLEDQVGVADARSNLGVVAHRLRRYDEAIAEHEASLALRTRIGNPWGIGTCHNNIGEVHRSRGDPKLAIAAYQRAFEIWEGIGYSLGAANALIGLGAARIDDGAAAAGRADLLSARERLTRLESTLYLAELHRYLALAELALGDQAAAEEAAGRSLTLAASEGARHQEAMTKRVLGQIALARGDRQAARALLEESRRALAELGETAELERTAALLAAFANER